MGIVYVLTNAAMPGLVKIGMTDDADANARIGQLYTTGVPLPFELAYACRVDNPGEVENALHLAFAPQRLNSRREFFKIAPEQAIAILKLLNKPDAAGEDATAYVASQPSPVDDASLVAAVQARARRPNLSFQEMGIQVGSVLEAAVDPAITVTVAGPKKVRVGNEELSLTAVTQQLLGLEYQVRPAPHWTYQGRMLSDIYEETYANPD